MSQSTATKHRPLHKIATDIRLHWPKPFYAAAPYIRAMGYMDSISDKYGADDARSIVLYFLSNAGTWKGDDARRIKAELRAMIGAK